MTRSGPVLIIAPPCVTARILQQACSRAASRCLGAVRMDVVAGARNKVSAYAQRAAASLDEKLVSQERPRVKKCFGLRWLQPRTERCQPLAS
jgi:hypothetical protein